MEEEWRTTHISDKHEVSNLGRVRSWARKGARKPRLLRMAFDQDGYFFTHIIVDGQHLYPRAHTLVLGAFVGPAPEDAVCRHLDGVRTNNHVVNLAWGTPMENTLDRTRHGNTLSGERHGRATLAREDVDAIRGLPGTLRSVAERFNTTIKIVWRIRHGKTWRPAII